MFEYYVYKPSSQRAKIKIEPFLVRYIGMSRLKQMVVLEKKRILDLLLIDLEVFKRDYQKLQGPKKLAAMRFFEEEDRDEEWLLREIFSE